MSVAVIPSNFTTALFVIVRNKVLMLQSLALKDGRLIGKKTKHIKQILFTRTLLISYL